MNRIKIEASIACANFRHLEKDIRELKECGVDYLHIDIMDGTFVPNFALDFSIMKTLHEITDIPLDCHLMIERPERYIEKTAGMGVKYISIHAEATHHLHRVIARVKEMGVRAGVALNPATPLTVLDYILQDIDMILLMTVNPGFAGQKLIPWTLNKIEQTRKLIDTRGFSHIDIQVDGNVSLENIPRMLRAGATMLVGGTSSLFREGYNIRDSMETILNIIKQSQ